MSVEQFQLADGDTPPPPMPETGVPAPPPDLPTAAVAATTMAAPAEKPTEKPADKPTAGGWEVDPDRLRGFTGAVVRARSYLDAVQKKVDRMQGTELTPQLGTSPVGEQLAKKFDDRLNADGGLRVMLAEAMTRMEKFVTSAEQAAKDYEEAEQTAVDTFNHQHDHHSKPRRG